MGLNFDRSKAYAPQEKDTFYDDGREIELLHFVYSHPRLDHIRGSPSGVLAAIDEYARTKKYLMNVGQDKGRIVSNLIKDVKPKIMVELGGYVGYSCILFGDALRKAGGQRYYSLEMNPEFAAVIMALVDLAGLSDTVKVIIGRSSQSLLRLKHDLSIRHIDLLFLDHHKPSYVLDLKICEYLKLVGPGTALAADNVIKPGNPPYLEYVRSSVSRKREEAEKPSEEKDGIVSGFFGVPAIEQRDGIVTRADGSIWCSGNANLIYESKLVESFEPTGIPDGVEITRCVGEENHP